MVNIAVEGDSDTELAKRIVQVAGHTVGKVRVARGASRLDPLIPKYHAASRFEPWVIFRDADSSCPVRLRDQLLSDVLRVSSLEPTFQLRIARTMSEAWLLADARSFATYFKVREGAVPRDPEQLPHAKKRLLELCSQSRSAPVREEVVAARIKPGPLYVHHLNVFAAQHWDANAASERSESLRRAIDRIGTIPDRISGQ